MQPGGRVAPGTDVVYVAPMTDQNPPPIVRADTRHRVTLGKEHAPTGKIFLFEVDEDGVIKLTPAVAVPLGSLAIDN